VSVPTALLEQTITIVDRTATGPGDEYGNPTDVDSAPVAVAGVLQQTERTESGQSDGTGEKARLLVASTAPLTTDSRVEVDGVWWEIDGPPWHVRNHRTGEVSHIEAWAVRGR